MGQSVPAPSVRHQVSRTSLIIVTVILLITTGAGWGLYLYQITRPTSPSLGVSGGFLNTAVVTYKYYNSTPYQCTPATNATTVTTCEVGSAGTFPSNALPNWVMVPAYAQLSIFGVPALGATHQGYSTFNNQTIVTHCGAGNTPTACPDHPALLYSPTFTAVEQHIGITSGYGGLPEGVLPTPAHDHIVDTDAGQANIPWYNIAVLVFDPNIMPDAITGRCAQIMPSGLSNATSNCLTSLSALQNALTTNNNVTIGVGNAKNPIWQTLGKPTTQVVIPGITIPSQIRNANSNLDIWFAVIDKNPYPPLAAPVDIGISSVITVMGMVTPAVLLDSKGEGEVQSDVSTGEQSTRLTYLETMMIRVATRVP